MYALPRILNLDKLFLDTPNAVVINNLLLNKTKEEMIEILCDVSNDRSDTVSTCECGKLTGNYYEGSICRSCGTICEQNLFGKIKNDMWLSIPNSIQKVLNPQVFLILSKWMGSVKRRPVVERILDCNEPQELIKGTPFYSGMGFNWFYENFSTLVEFFSQRRKSNSVKLMLKIAGDDIWCTKLPILSKLIQPISGTKNSRYADPDLQPLIKSIITMSSMLLAERVMRFNDRKIESTFMTVYKGFTDYATTIEATKLAKKPSILRKHVFGSRYHCTGRSVAIPIIDPHESDEIYLPWKLGVMMYKYHIISYLINRHNMNVMDAYSKVTIAVLKYDYDIDRIMGQLIEECPYKGLPMLVNRNPSLRMAAIQLLYVTRIKPGLKSDPFRVIANDENGDQRDYININVSRYIEDGAIEVSPMITKGPNLD